MKALPKYKICYIMWVAAELAATHLLLNMPSERTVGAYLGNRSVYVM